MFHAALFVLFLNDSQTFRINLGQYRKSADHGWCKGSASGIKGFCLCNNGNKSNNENNENENNENNENNDNENNDNENNENNENNDNENNENNENNDNENNDSENNDNENNDNENNDNENNDNENENEKNDNENNDNESNDSENNDNDNNNNNNQHQQQLQRCMVVLAAARCCKELKKLNSLDFISRDPAGTLGTLGGSFCSVLMFCRCGSVTKAYHVCLAGLVAPRFRRKLEKPKCLDFSRDPEGTLGTFWDSFCSMLSTKLGGVSPSRKRDQGISYPLGGLGGCKMLQRAGKADAAGF